MNHYYETAVDSATGKKISDFWEKCNRCNQASHDYAKKMGAESFEPDYNAFEGGVTALYFPDDAKVDLGVWQLLTTDPKTQKGMYVPRVESRMDYIEIPHRDYALKDSFDRIYKRDSIVQQEDGRLLVPFIQFYRDEPGVGSNGQPRAASKGLRKAIKAEVRRRRLPVMRVGTLFGILGTELPQDVREVSMPTFFPYRSRYFIGCAYPCVSADLLEITPQQYKMNEGKWRCEAARQQYT